MSAVTLPQARIPLGWVTVSGARIPVEIDIEWMRAFSGLVVRTGGTSGETGFTEFLPLLFEQSPSDPVAQESMRAVDELRNELASARNEMRELRTMIESIESQAVAIRQATELRNRLELIEDRLA